MKLILSIAFTLLTFVSGAQEFMGVKLEGDKATFINKFKAKGFVLTYADNPNAVTMKGTVGGKQYELILFSTPTTKQVWKLSVYLPEATSWSRIKSEYEDYLGILTEKYGAPEKAYTFFSSPYSEGDGYEMNAIKLEKCHYSAFWSDSVGIWIEISKFQQVKIAYENAKNSALNDLEKKQINSQIF
jgi:hypothetical protein